MWNHAEQERDTENIVLGQPLTCTTKEPQDVILPHQYYVIED